MNLAATSLNASYSAGYIVIALVVSLILCVACGKLMQEAGQPFWAGALLGFFCGIFGLIVALIFYFSREKRSRNPIAMYPPEMYGYGPPSTPYPPPPAWSGPQPHVQPGPGTAPCPQCSSPNQVGAEFCGYCGVYLLTSPGQPAASWKVCSLCHNRVPATNAYCPNCGSNLAGSATW
ncbi:MAG: double zinc ribbon domain-containing protein [Candidatus Geothermincolia bacterium]